MSAHQATLRTSAARRTARTAILILVLALAIAGVLAGLDGLLTHSGLLMHHAATNGTIHIGAATNGTVHISI